MSAKVGKSVDLTKGSVVRSILSWKRARESYPFSEALIVLKKSLSIYYHLGRVDAKFVFIRDFSSTQESTLSVEKGSEDQIDNRCKNRWVHLVNKYVWVTTDKYNCSDAIKKL